MVTIKPKTPDSAEKDSPQNTNYLHPDAVRTVHKTVVIFSWNEQMHAHAHGIKLMAAQVFV